MGISCRCSARTRSGARRTGRWKGAASTRCRSFGTGSGGGSRRRSGATKIGRTRSRRSISPIDDVPSPRWGPHRGDARAPAAAHRRAVPRLGTRARVGRPARRRQRIDGARGGLAPPQRAAAHRHLGTDRDHRLRRIGGAAPPATGAAVGGIRRLPAILPGHSECGLPRGRGAIPRERRDAHQAAPRARGAARAAKHRAHRGHAPADEGPGSVARGGRHDGDVIPAHHDALRAVALPRLLLGAAVADEQGGSVVRPGFTGSRAARCRERRGDADYRAVAQDLAEDHDHRHPGALPEAPVTGAIVRTVLVAVLFMGTVLVYVPFFLASGPETAHWTLGPWRYVGLLPLAAGVAGLAWCLRDFALVGRGTPAPFDPPRQLVATGLYRWVRNPMYLSALSLLVGEAALLEAPVLLRYAAGFFLVAHLFVVLYEEPALRRTFGESYDRYRATVPRWLARRSR